MIDYRAFRLSKLNTPEFSHLKLLLFWPFYGLCFLLLERFLPLNFHPIECALDAFIPFCEYFVPVYYYWFIYQIGMILYLLLTDREGFRLNGWFVILTYSVTLLVYVIYPSCQNLRPAAFPRDNLCSRIVGMLYAFDTNTNVCPSIHVIGSLAVWLAARDTKTLPAFARRWLIPMLAVSVCASTVLLKQHSVLDVLAALAVSGAGRYIVCRAPVTVARPLRTRSTV